MHQLAGTWLDQLEGATTSRAQESTPVVVGGKLYVQTSQGNVFSIDGATGQVIWEYKSGFPGTERGVAVSGGQVFAALGGEHVVALNQQTGKQQWLAQVGTPGQDTSANGSATPWTMFADGLVLVGTENGGDSGMRGHLDALNASTGKVTWTFADGLPRPGRAQHLEGQLLAARRWRHLDGARVRRQARIALCRGGQPGAEGDGRAAGRC